MTTQIPADHAAHDLELVAAHAAGDADPSVTRVAEALLARCPDCRVLAADLAALARATRALPSLARDRDFRITPEAAARLRPGSPVRRLVDALLAPRGFGRPLAGAMMTLGLAGLLVASLPTWLPGAATFTTGGERDGVAPISGGATNLDGGGPSVAPGAAGKEGGTDGSPPAGPGDPAAQPEPAPSASSDGADAVRPSPPGATTAPGGAQAGGESPGAPSGKSADGVESDDGPAGRALDLGSPMVIGSAVLLAAGILLLLVRRLAPGSVRRPGS